jgi:hypothetical protein
MKLPLLREHHLTALVVLSFLAIIGLMLAGYSRFLFLVMPFSWLGSWAIRKRKVMKDGTGVHGHTR